ncbi:MAG TPA: 3'-5' exonuclease [Pseudomonadota bacterium]|jgi:DNA polymerase-3 subunit epsilon|nr:3'-5' exonuclease [Pseudomonadota bacterium]
MLTIGGGLLDEKVTDWPGVVIDTETTGVSVQTDRVVELGAIFCLRGSVVDSRKMRLNPQMKIPAEASAVHGICDEHVAGKPTFAQIADRFVDYITGRARQDVTPWLCGYNAVEFDGPLLNAELLRAGIDVQIDVSQIVDPITFVRWHLRHLRSRSLKSACEHFGVPLENAHSALADAQATLRLLHAMVEHRYIPTRLGDILSEQARLGRIMKEEWDRWSYWLYRDREDGSLRFGAGSHCGQPVRDVGSDYIESLLRKVPDLPDEVRTQLRAHAA